MPSLLPGAQVRTNRTLQQIKSSHFYHQFCSKSFMGVFHASMERHFPSPTYYVLCHSFSHFQ